MVISILENFSYIETQLRYNTCVPECCIALIFEQLERLSFPRPAEADKPSGVVDVFPVAKSDCEPEVGAVNT